MARADTRDAIKQRYKSWAYVNARTVTVARGAIPALPPGPSQVSQFQNSIGLAAQERRNFQLVIIHRLVHRKRLPAMDI